MFNGFERIVTSEQRLREVLGQPMKRALLKEHARLDAHFRAFIAGSPFLLLATSSGAGRCDVSPKGDEAGFVRVLDETHLAIPRPHRQQPAGRDAQHSPEPARGSRSSSSPDVRTRSA